MRESTYIILLFMLIGLMFIALGMPLKHEMVRPNWWYGFRTRKTLSNLDVWYAINRITGVDMIRAGSVLTAVSLVLLALRNSLSAEAAIAILIAAMLITVGWMAYHGFSALAKM